MTAPNAPVVFVDIIKTQAPDDWPADSRWQPYRWVAKNAGNQAVLCVSSEHYTNKQDCLDAITQCWGPGTNVFQREAEHGDQVLRQVAQLSLLDGTAEFMRLARQSAGEWLADPPMTEAGFQQLRELRRALLREEFAEYTRAEANSDLVEIVDGLLDVIVIAWGTLISYVGEEKAKAAAAEVVRSNLDKVVGEGLPVFRADGKVLKPEGWQPPDIAGAIA